MDRWWGLLLLMLAACEPEPRGPVQVMQPEAMRFDTEHLRREVDGYKTQPTEAARSKMEKAFGAVDARVRDLEALAQTQSGPERISTEQQIADLKHRRELHWTRAQTALAETQPIKRAEPVAERVVKAEHVIRTERVKRVQRTRSSMSQQAQRTEPRGEPMNIFQRFFR